MFVIWHPSPHHHHHTRDLRFFSAKSGLVCKFPISQTWVNQNFDHGQNQFLESTSYFSIFLNNLNTIFRNLTIKLPLGTNGYKILHHWYILFLFHGPFNFFGPIICYGGICFLKICDVDYLSSVPWTVQCIQNLPTKLASNSSQNHNHPLNRYLWQVMLPNEVMIVLVKIYLVTTESTAGFAN